MTNRPLGYFELNTNKLFIYKDNLMGKIQYPRNDEGEIIHGCDLKTFDRVYYSNNEPIIISNIQLNL